VAAAKCIQHVSLLFQRSVLLNQQGNALKKTTHLLKTGSLRHALFGICRIFAL